MPDRFQKIITRIGKNKTAMLIGYKLLHDTFFLFLAFFALAMLSEGILPGVIISKISLSTIMILCSLNFISIVILSSSEVMQNYKNSPVPEKSIPLKTLSFFFLALLIFNSQLEMNIFLNISILLTMLLIVYLVFQTILETKKNDR